MPDSQDITLLLQQIGKGNENAPDELLAVVYEELRRLAYDYMQNERSDHTLQPTALVHEAFIQFIGWENVTWQNRAHSFAVAARIMRQVLIESARQKKSAKRGGNWQKIVLDEAISFPTQQGKELYLLEINDAINDLAEKRSDAQGIFSEKIPVSFASRLRITKTILRRMARTRRQRFVLQLSGVGRNGRGIGANFGKSD